MSDDDLFYELVLMPDRRLVTIAADATESDSLTRIQELALIEIERRCLDIQDMAGRSHG